MKTSLFLASAVLLLTSAVASAQNQNQMPRNPDQPQAGAPSTTGRTGTTGAPSSTNPQATSPNGLRDTPHEVPESGGAPMRETPGRAPSR
jgi:hypothetical protein